jgi:hypothetical protein
MDEPNTQIHYGTLVEKIDEEVPELVEGSGMTEEEEMLEAAMGIISNSTDWTKENKISKEWQGAARKWLDKYQKYLSERFGASADDPAYNVTDERA